MRVYHRTDHAGSILQTGFRDGSGSYMATGGPYTGVWLSTVPLGVNEGANGAALLAIEVDEQTFASHEWVEDGKGYREALIPARLVNGCRAELVFASEDEEFEWADRHAPGELP